ncbi:hypothetical protein FQR65_LT00151 [Abscondita terminalis]|nr:hypothetical protein FQR65_LT00151 [Abscondita terminalis]
MAVIAEERMNKDNQPSLTENEESAIEKLFKTPRMTKDFILNHCKQHKLYQTPHLNDVLYLHYKGFSRIENLEEYTGLKCLWLENNGINAISGLDNQTDLRSLFLHYNLIKKIENLNNCPNLNMLNLSHNQVRRIENLEANVKLQTLNLGNNYLESVNELEHLVKLPEISVLDLSNNHIDDPLVVEVFSRMESLRVLCLNGNPVIRKIPAYRKTLTLACTQLKYLDDRPVFPRDRACAEAWKRGGIAEEQAERQRWINRENQRIMDSVDDLLRLRDERRATLQQQDSGMGASINDSESEPHSIDGENLTIDYANACKEIETVAQESDEDDMQSEYDFMEERQTTEDYYEYTENIFDFEPKKKKKLLVEEIIVETDAENGTPANQQQNGIFEEQKTKDFIDDLPYLAENITAPTFVNKVEVNEQDSQLLYKEDSEKEPTIPSIDNNVSVETIKLEAKYLGDENSEQSETVSIDLDKEQHSDVVEISKPKCRDENEFSDQDAEDSRNVGTDSETELKIHEQEISEHLSVMHTQNLTLKVNSDYQNQSDNELSRTCSPSDDVKETDEPFVTEWKCDLSSTQNLGDPDNFYIEQEQELHLDELKYCDLNVDSAENDSKNVDVDPEMHLQNLTESINPDKQNQPNNSKEDPQTPSQNDNQSEKVSGDSAQLTINLKPNDLVKQKHRLDDQDLDHSKDGLRNFNVDSDEDVCQQFSVLHPQTQIREFSKPFDTENKPHTSTTARQKYEPEKLQKKHENERHPDTTEFYDHDQEVFQKYSVTHPENLTVNNQNQPDVSEEVSISSQNDVIREKSQLEIGKLDLANKTGEHDYHRDESQFSDQDRDDSKIKLKVQEPEILQVSLVHPHNLVVSVNPINQTQLHKSSELSKTPSKNDYVSGEIVKHDFDIPNLDEQEVSKHSTSHTVSYQQYQVIFADDTCQNTIFENESITKPKLIDSGISVASWTEATHNRGTSTDFQSERDVFDELIRHTKQAESSGSESDISTDKYPNNRKLNRGIWRLDEGESEIATEVFDRKKCAPRTLPVGEDECDINDIRELLTWQINKTLVPMPYQEPRNQEEVRDVNIEMTHNYNEYIKECDKKIASDAFKAPGLSKMLMMTPHVSVSKNERKEREQIEDISEEIRIGTSEPSIGTNKISELRMDIERFRNDADKFNKQYEDLMENFIQTYNECNEREKNSKFKDVPKNDDLLKKEQKGVERKKEDLPIVTHEVSCTLEMRLAKEND